MTYRGREDNELSLWSEDDGMYYDAIQFGPGQSIQLPIRSLVGLIPLYATLTLEPSVINRFPGFRKRMEWFIENRPELSARNLANMKRKFFYSMPAISPDVLLVPSSWKRRQETIGLGE
jgi:hypothetical protein